MPYLTVDGTRLFYSDQGDDDAPALLLLHGAGASHLAWPAAMRRLAGARVLGLDLPGHGRSDRPGRRAVAHYAATVAAFIDALDLSKVVLAGHSMGAAIALTVAREQVAAVRGLVLLGAGPRLRVNDLVLSGSLSNLEAAADFIVNYGFVAAPNALRRRTRDAFLEAGSMTIFGDFLACQHFDARPWLAGVDVPALVIAAAEDRLVPPRAAEALAAGLPRGRLARLEGAGHFAMLEQPAAVAELTAGFFAQVTGSAAGQHAAQ